MRPAVPSRCASPPGRTPGCCAPTPRPSARGSAARWRSRSRTAAVPSGDAGGRWGSPPARAHRARHARLGPAAVGRAAGGGRDGPSVARGDSPLARRSCSRGRRARAPGGGSDRVAARAVPRAGRPWASPSSPGWPKRTASPCPGPDASRSERAAAGRPPWRSPSGVGIGCSSSPATRIPSGEAGRTRTRCTSGRTATHVEPCFELPLAPRSEWSRRGRVPVATLRFEHHERVSYLTRRSLSHSLASAGV